MHKQTIRIILYSSTAIMVMALVWGFRQIPQQTKLAENTLRLSVDQESIVLNGAVKATTQALKYRLLDVLKAEGNDHTTRAFQDSPFLVATLLEWDQAQWKPLWYSVKSKTDFQAGELSSWIPGWPLSKLGLDEVFYSKVGEIQGQAYFAILVPVRRPNQVPMVGMGIFPANQFGLTFSSDQNREIRVFDSQGHALALTHPAYLGASVKSEPLIKQMLDDDEVSLHQEWQGEHGLPMFGIASKVSDSNLYVAIESPLTVGGNPALQNWIYLLLCALGTAALNWFLFSGLLKPLLTELSQTEQANETLRKQLQEGGAPRVVRPVPVEMDQMIPSTALPGYDFREGAAVPHAAPVGGPMASEPSATVPGVSIERIVQASLRSLLAKTTEYKINVMQFGLGDLRLEADSLQLQTALEEILKNSIEAMGDSPTRNLTISGTKTADLIRLSVEDTGCGIPEANVEKVFDPFFSTKDSQGVARGLGLNVVRRVVEELSGRVHLTSHQGEGSTSGTRVDIEWPGTGTVSTKPTVPASPIPNMDFEVELDAFESIELDQIQVPQIMAETKLKYPENAIRKPKVRTLD